MNANRAIPLLRGKTRLVAVGSDETVFVSTARGVSPLLDVLETSPERLKDAVCADRVVGKAAAMLFVKCGVKAVHGEVMSRAAADFLLLHNMPHTYGKLVENIRNRRGDGICPMEEAVLAVDDLDEAEALLRRKRDESAGAPPKKKRSRPLPLRAAETVIELVGIALLAFFFYRWADAAQPQSNLSYAASVISCLLFGALAVCAVGKAFAEFRTRSLDNPLRGGFCAEKEPCRDLLHFGIFFAVAVTVFFAGGLLAMFLRNSGGYFASLKALWLNLDSQHYIHIAKHWYASEGDLSNVVRIVFLPGYPLFIRLFSFLTGDAFYAAALVSALSFGGVGVMLYRLVNLESDRFTARRALCFVCCIPGAFFFAAPMTESLFLFCTLASIYFIRTKKWLPAALFGAYAAFTRSVGGILVLVFLAELLWDAREKYRALKDEEKSFAPYGKSVRRLFFTVYGARALLSLLIAAGLGAYLLVNLSVFGNPFQFLIYQKEHWHQQLGWFFNSAEYMVSYLRSYLAEGKTQVAIGLWGMGLFAIFASLITLLAGQKKLRFSYLLYSLAYFFISVGATWLLSAPRYLAALFTLPICLAFVTKKKAAFFPLLVLSALLNVAYLLMFVKGWQVW